MLSRGLVEPSPTIMYSIPVVAVGDLEGDPIEHCPGFIAPYQ